MIIHPWLRKARETSAEGLNWLDRLPDLVEQACRDWKLVIAGVPYDGGVCGWVAPVRSARGDAVLKVSWPHSEARTEAVALRWWDGSGSVRLLAENPGTWTMLLERCRPGTPLRDAGLPSGRGLAIGAELLNALWGKGAPPTDGPHFDTMAAVCNQWADEADRRLEAHGAALVALGTDPAVLRTGIELLRSLPGSAERQVVVHGDFNPGNVLAAGRAPYLAIDPKPMVGDPAYDPWSLVAQLDWPFRLGDAGRVVLARIDWLAGELDLPAQRIAAWGVARDVQGGLWAASAGNPALGAKWLRSAMITAAALR